MFTVLVYTWISYGCVIKFVFACENVNIFSHYLNISTKACFDTRILEIARNTETEMKVLVVLSTYPAE